ncbi:IclR family transcriptional regulator [Paracoccus saliphilus]|uniref:IclR family transcriptional regulator n=1 Tax=Paracoccus saliphilus TaxID=405559 RepID=A0AA45W695_9RHOB|nr:IclR family transcriptional regulator [Paracoccus saliphilus]WCR01513.1 IclR family transcriptional regulator [Paracoccus saliphilus]SIS99401.1 transcriptional regulator, IclR family [Paracoccus saliphilus]
MAEQLNNSILTAFDILTLLSDNRQTITKQDLTTELGLRAATAHRFLRSLEVAGALSLDKRGQYRLSSKLVDLGASAMSANVGHRCVQEVLEELAQKSEETALATIMRRGKVVIIARANSPRPYSIHMNVGAELELHCTANGKIWLANMTMSELQEYLGTVERRKFTPNTIFEGQAIIEEARRVREAGYSICIAEREEEVSAVAVPIRTSGGTLLMSISVFGPRSHFNSDFRVHSLDLLNDAAERISSALD